MTNDTDRLDWLLYNTAFVLKDERGYFVAYYAEEPERTRHSAPRQAIDRAMETEQMTKLLPTLG